MAAISNQKDSFGRFLQAARERAGYSSLRAAADQVRRLRPKGDRLLSRSMLHLYEQDRVRTSKAESLNLISELYRVPYEEIVERWVAWSYGVPAKRSGGNSFVATAHAGELTLSGIRGKGSPGVSIITLQEFKDRQRALPRGSQVFVATTIFRDDELFFDVSSSNIRRGIVYHFLCPSSQYSNYRGFLTRFSKEFKFKSKIDRRLTNFYSRPILDNPLNYVVYQYPDDRIEGFTALTVNTEPHCHQVADPELSWRLHASFRWTAALGGDEKLSKLLAELQIKVERAYQNRTL